MTKTQQMLNELKSRPMTGNELKDKWGGAWTGQRARLIRYGAIEKFQTPNENSGGRFERLIVWKYRVIGDYCPHIGRLPCDEKSKSKRLPTKSIEKAIALLTANGYTVAPNA